MSKKQVLITAATRMEIEPLYKYSVPSGDMNIIEGSDTTYHLFVSGIGSVLTAFSLGKILQKYKYDEAFQLGIAGSFSRGFPIGSVLKITSDLFADLCIDDNGNQILPNDSCTDDFQKPPFVKGRLIPDLAVYKHLYLHEASAITVNTATDSTEKSSLWVLKYNPGIETMEGAAFYFACMKENISCLQIRSISNLVGPRNTKNWDIPLAVQNLCTYTITRLLKL